MLDATVDSYGMGIILLMIKLDELPMKITLNLNRTKDMDFRHQKILDLTKR